MLKPFLIFAAVAAVCSLACGGVPETEFAQLNDLFLRTGPRLGDPAPDFSLERARGGTVRASELWAQKPLMVTTGSFSCPQFREVTEGRRGLVREFSERMSSVVVYTIEAHPTGSPSPYVNREWVTEENKRDGILLAQPQTYDMRLGLAQRCREALKMLSFVAVDKMDNATWKAYGSSPNCAYLIDTRGRVVFRQGLFNKDEMRAAIRKLLAAEAAPVPPR